MPSQPTPPDSTSPCIDERGSFRLSAKRFLFRTNNQHLNTRESKSSHGDYGGLGDSHLSLFQYIHLAAFNGFFCNSMTLYLYTKMSFPCRFVAVWFLCTSVATALDLNTFSGQAQVLGRQREMILNQHQTDKTAQPMRMMAKPDSDDSDGECTKTKGCKLGCCGPL